MLLSVNQSGKRKGSGAFYLEPWHIDIEDFIDVTKHTGDERRRCPDIHTALWIPDRFMEAVKNNETWYLFSPDEAVGLHDAYGEEFNRLYDHYISVAKAGGLSNWQTT